MLQESTCITFQFDIINSKCFTYQVINFENITDGCSHWDAAEQSTVR